MFAWLAVLSIAMTGSVLAQPALPSLVTQQTRLSTGGATPGYVQLRAKPGITSLNTTAYFWDQAPTPAVGVNYSMWLDENNNIERSNSFGVAQKGYLLQVNATGNGLQWVAPFDLTGANQGLTIDSTTTPGTSFVQMGSTSAILATGASAFTNDRYVDINGHALNYTGGGSFSVGDGVATQNITFDPKTTGIFAIHNLNPTLLSTKLLVLGGGDSVMTRDLSSLVVADNGLSINAVGGFVELGAAATGGAKLLVPRFVTLNSQTLNFDGSGNFNVGDGTGVQLIKIDPSATGSVTINNLPTTTPIAVTDKFVYLDGTTNKASTRTLASLVNANNGLLLDIATTPGTPIVQLGGAATATAPLLVDRFVTLGGKALNFDGTGKFNVGDGTSAQNIALDPSATGSLEFHNIAINDGATKFLVLGGNDSVRYRDLSSLVSADNGLTINAVGGFVELGSLATAGAPLLRTSFVTLNGHDLTFDGTGNFTIGGGASVQAITLDPGATGSTNFKNLAPIAAAAATDRFVVMAAGNDKAFTRSLSSLVGANQGLIVDSSSGVSIVQLGATVDGTNPISVGRFITMTGATPSLTYDGTGTLNLGTTGNLALNINTGTQQTTWQSTVLDVTGAAGNANNFLWVDTVSNQVHRARTSTMARDNSAIDFLAVDHTTGNIVRAISPTNGIYRGHVAWASWNQTITLPAGQTILAGASITVTIENHASQGTVPVQVTNVGGTTFDIAASDDPTAGSFINYIVMNP